MDPFRVPASATRGKQTVAGGQGARTETSGQGRKCWSVDDLPIERYKTNCGRMGWWDRLESCYNVNAGISTLL